jgi:hypothetical protein
MTKPEEARFPEKPRGSAERWKGPGSAWSFVILAALAFIVYAPALNRVFAADQLYYLAELKGDDSPGAGLALYDYAAYRQYQKGDDISFRPLLFTWLALCNTLFSYHHVWWNLATLGLHALVAFFLYRFLQEIQPSPLALAVSALFVVLKPAVELPVWSHLGGYLLAWLCFAIGARAFTRMTVSGLSDRRTLLEYGVSMTAASLCHESMFLVSILGGIIVLAVDRLQARPTFPARMFAVVAPILIFSTLYGFHMFRVERLGYVSRPDSNDVGLGAGRLVDAIRLTPEAVVRWGAEMAVPSALSIYGPPFNRLRKAMISSSRWPANLFNGILAFAAIGLLLSTSSGEHRRRTLPVLLFLGGSILIYVLALSFSRASAEVRGVAYYVYFYCLAMTPFLYALGDVGALQGKKGAAIWAMTLTFFISHSFQTSVLTGEIGRNNALASAYFTGLEGFVDRHRDEGGFTFAIETVPSELDPRWSIREGYPDNPRAIHEWPVSEIVFRKYYRAENPSRVIRWDGSKIEERPGPSTGNSGTDP